MLTSADIKNVRRIVAVLCGNFLITRREDVEDLQQEVLIGIWKDIDQFDPLKSSFVTWCLMVARCAILGWLRKKGNRTYNGSTLFTNISLPDFDRDAFHDALCGSYDPWEEVDTLLRIELSLSISSDPFSRAVVGRYYGLDEKEIADALGMTRKAVNNLLFNTRKKLIKDA